MTVGRRDFIIGSLGVAATSKLLDGCSDDSDNGAGDGGSSGDAATGVDGGVPANSALFAHGVGSGDPLADAVLIWTRISGQTQPVAVSWTFASDAALQQVVQTGTVTTSADVDYTVQTDVKALTP
ncbi:MAG: Alkaline phosphatase, partial [Myxococcaceae bacterium]|nr:Alkaline phosphatase [Myxococcaceae bacterium]